MYEFDCIVARIWCCKC